MSTGDEGGAPLDGADAAARVLAALRIERGTPDPEELAALTVVLTRISQQPATPPPPLPASHWADRRHVLGLAPAPGPGGWRASGLPR